MKRRRLCAWYPSTSVGVYTRVSIMPVVSDGTMSFELSTTGLKPLLTHASLLAGSPFQQNSLPLRASSRFGRGAVEKK